MRGAGQIVITPGRALGLLFAGSFTATTIISPIGPILTEFGVMIDGN